MSTTLSRPTALEMKREPAADAHSTMREDVRVSPSNRFMDIFDIETGL